jgi:hypothetical protein
MLSPNTFMATLLLLVGLADVAAAKSPNFIVILTDDQSWVQSTSGDIPSASMRELARALFFVDGIKPVRHFADVQSRQTVA